MAGIFGFFDFTREGPGVPKDAPPKNPIIVFFEIVGRKFWKLVQLNLIYTLFSLPAIAYLFILSNLFAEPITAEEIDLYLARFVFSLMFLAVPFVTVGPAAAGFTYVLRNFAREDHAWVWSDFLEHSRRNLKEGLIITLIDWVAAFLILFNINAYNQLASHGFFFLFAKYVFILMAIIYLMMHLYIYPLLVTFKLNVRQIFKNAFIFTMLKPLRNLLITVLCFAIVYLTFYPNVFLGGMLFASLTVSFTGLIINFYVYPTMKKYMMKGENGVSSEEVKNKGFGEGKASEEEKALEDVDDLDGFGEEKVLEDGNGFEKGKTSEDNNDRENG